VVTKSVVTKSVGLFVLKLYIWFGLEIYKHSNLQSLNL